MLDNSHDTNGNQESLSLFTARVHVHLQGTKHIHVSRMIQSQM